MKQQIKAKREHIDAVYNILRDNSLTCTQKLNELYKEIKKYESSM